MRITKLSNPMLLVHNLIHRLEPFGIQLTDVEYPTKSSVKFRASRTFNKPYCGGGIKFGACTAVNGYGQLLYPYILTPKFKQTKHLHWEEWALINDQINNICDLHNLGGSCKSFFDGQLQYIRKNGLMLWKSYLDSREIETLILEAQKHVYKAS